MIALRRLTMTTPSAWAARLFLTGILLSTFAERSLAQKLTQDPFTIECTVIAGNQSGLLTFQGTYSVTNVPADRPVRVQIVCDEPGGPLGASPDELPAVAGGVTEMGPLP